MKSLKFILLGVLSLIVLIFVALFIFIKTFDVNKYLPQITQQMSHAIQRKVEIEHINLDLNLFSGLSLNVKGVSIADDTTFSKNSFLTMSEVYLNLDIPELVLKRKIYVTKVTIRSPKISIIRSSEGAINAATIRSSSNASKEPLKETSKESSPSKTNSSSAASLPEISIKSIFVDHAQILFEDLNPKMPLHVLLDNVEANISDFSLNRSFNFTININAWGKGKDNIDVNGRCTLDLSKNAAHIQGLQIKSDLSQWDLAKVKTATTILEKAPVWPQEIKGNLLIDIPQLNASATGLEKIALTLSLTEGFVKLKELLSPINNIDLKVESDLTDLTIKGLKANIGTGEIDAKGDIHNLLTLPQYDFQITTKDLKVEEMVDENKFSTVLKGDLESQFSLSGESFEPEAMLKNLKGQGDISLKGAKLEKMNLLNAIVSKLNFIPGLGNQITSNLSTNVRNKLSSDTTVLDKASAKIKIQDKIATITDGQIDSNVFSITAQGTVSFDVIADIDVKTYLAPDVSNDLVRSAKPLAGLLDDQKRLCIPGKVSGQGAGIKFMPLIDDITKKTIVNEGADQLQKVLDKNPKIKNILNSVLGGGEGQDNSSNSTDDQAQPQEDSTKKLINNVFKKIGF